MEEEKLIDDVIDWKGFPCQFSCRHKNHVVPIEEASARGIITTRNIVSNTRVEHEPANLLGRHAGDAFSQSVTQANFGRFS